MAAHLAVILVAIQLTAPREIPLKTLRDAQKQAEHMLSDAGVKPLWSAHADFRLLIVNTAFENRTPDATGFAVLIPDNPGYAGITWPAIKREAAQMEVDASILMGAVMAHEIGHLLFGPAHWHAGVMSPRLGPKEMLLAARGELRFEGRRELCLTRNSRHGALQGLCAIESANTSPASARGHSADRAASAGGR